MSQEAYILAYQAWDDQKKDSWEQTRLIAYSSEKPYFKRPITIERFMPLKWDQKRQAPPSSRKRFDQLRKKFDKIINK